MKDVQNLGRLSWEDQMFQEIYRLSDSANETERKWLAFIVDKLIQTHKFRCQLTAMLGMMDEGAGKYESATARHWYWKDNLLDVVFPKGVEVRANPDFGFQTIVTMPCYQISVREGGLLNNKEFIAENDEEAFDMIVDTQLNQPESDAKWRVEKVYRVDTNSGAYTNITDRFMDFTSNLLED